MKGCCNKSVGTHPVCLPRRQSFSCRIDSRDRPSGQHRIMVYGNSRVPLWCKIRISVIEMYCLRTVFLVILAA